MRERKSTEVSWIGEIPLDWELKKIKRVFKTTNGYGFPEKLQGEKSGDIPFLKVSDFPKNSDFILSSSNYVSLDILNQKNWKTTEPMSIITAKIGEAMKKNHRKINVEPCLIDNNMMALTVKEGLLKYLFYVSKVIDFSWFANPGAIPSLNHRHFRESYIMSPPIVEQQKIANFLDQKTSEIDTLISHKEKLIVLLEEKRQAIITEAVTKGLNPDVKMKDSGVEWIGEIPEHWDINKFKKVVKIQEGPGIMANDFKESGVPLIRISGVKSEVVTLKGCNYLDPIKVKEKWNHFRLSKGDLLVSGSASVDIVSRVQEEAIDCIPYTGLIRLKSYEKNIYQDYLYWFLKSHIFNVSIELLRTGSTIKHFGPTHLKEFNMIIPPLKVQRKIINYLNEYVSNINELIQNTKDTLDKLTEYRQALIYEAVTGKIDVQEMVKETEQEEVSSS